MRKNLYKYSKSVACLTATGAKVVASSPQNSATVDRFQGGLGDYNSVLFVAQAGTITDGTHVLSVQESVDGTVWTNVTASPDLSGVPPTWVAAQSNVVADFGYVGAQRYCRAVVTSSGTTTGAIIGVVAVLYGTAGWRR